MSSLSSGATGTTTGQTFLRAGWLYHRESILGKMWRQKWVTLAPDGTLIVATHKTSKRRGRRKYNLRQDCMFIWTADQCRNITPPKEMDNNANLIEILLTGERRMALCGLTLEDSQMWYKSIETARVDADAPTPGPPSLLHGVAEERSARCCFCFRRPSSRVKAIDYRPSTKQSISSLRAPRRVSWSNHVTTIGE